MSISQEEREGTATPPDPSKTRYLRDPNYYRLAYQRAAQYANWLLSSSMLVTAGASSETQPNPNPEEVLAAASEAASEAGRALAWLDARKEKHRWWKPRPKKLSPKEERLRRFLESTVKPSAELVKAGVLIFLQRIEEAEAHGAPIRNAKTGSISYRALYNLACYETAREEASPPAVSSGDRFGAALEQLSKALRLAPGRFQHELVRWARSDPSLGPLRTSRGTDFEKLLARFENSELKDDPAVPAVRAPSVAGSDT